MIDEITDIFVIVKNIPKPLSINDCEELFSMLNLKSFKFLPNSDEMGNNAFMTFQYIEDAYVAVFNLHERRILNNYLSAKILRKKPINFCTEESNFICDQALTSNQPNNENVIPDWVKELLAFAPILNFTEPTKPKLRYKYPKPNNIILTNIVRALISNENFYTQTLHLMNKFNFPIPFSNDVTFPGRIIVINSDEINKNKEPKSRMENIELTEMEISSGNESEIPDDYHSPRIKRRKISLPKIGKIHPIINYPFKFEPMKTYSIGELFDTNTNKLENQIKLNITSIFNNVNESQIDATFVEENGFGKICNIPQSNFAQVSNNFNDNFPLIKGTTIKILDNSNSDTKSKAEIISKPEKMLSADEIIKKKLSETIWSSIGAFKKYNPGIPSCRLYVKNLSKKVTKEDLISLYSVFINWSDSDEIDLFSVTCFTEGRMKGQAFINFPSVAISERALELTNAFVLHDKPLVVQFAKTTS